jgi:hypothetical protein
MLIRRISPSVLECPDLLPPIWLIKTEQSRIILILSLMPIKYNRRRGKVLCRQNIKMALIFFEYSDEVKDSRMKNSIALFNLIFRLESDREQIGGLGLD